MQSPRFQAILAILVFGAASAGTSANLAFGAANPATSQQTVPGRPPEAGPNRPANVPDGYVITPFGFFHPSCVQSLAKGEHLLADGRIEHADGIVEETAAVCTHPHYTGGRNPAGTAANSLLLEKNTPSAINGWVENANMSTGSNQKSYGAIVATWAVPNQPLADNGQVLYYFPGFEDINDTESILQPVLEWYRGQWTIASWNCCLNGIATSSAAVSVRSGDEIYGSVTSACAPGTLACPTWNVLTLDMTRGESTTLSNTPSEGQTFNWAFGGVLETYYATTCGDYPLDRHMRFNNITVFDQYQHPISNPKWATGVDDMDTQQCHYAVLPSPHAVTLDY